MDRLINRDRVLSQGPAADSVRTKRPVFSSFCSTSSLPVVHILFILINDKPRPRNYLVLHQEYNPRPQAESFM